MTAPEEPSLAERARTALAQATTATLLTRDCRTSSNLTVVALQDRPGDSPLLWLERTSPIIARLASCPVATLVAAGPSPVSVLHLVGTFHPVRSAHAGHGARPGHAGECDCRGYRCSLLGVRLVGSDRASIPVDEFLRAEPDPLRRDAPAMLHHLESAHADDLLACVRAHGHDALAVVPRALDRYGIELAAIGPDGVSRLRLVFPDRPLSGLDRLGAGFRLPLTCRCGGRRH